MSLYGIVFGSGQQTADRASVLLAILGNPDPGRLRDAWVERGEDGEPVIAVYTRNGGGNRECYCDDYSGPDHEQGSCTGCTGDRFADHPLCFDSPDDEFDCTYRTYYFRAPDEHRELLRSVAGDHVDTDQRWTDAIAALGQ